MVEVSCMYEIIGVVKGGANSMANLVATLAPQRSNSVNVTHESILGKTLYVQLRLRTTFRSRLPSPSMPCPHLYPRTRHLPVHPPTKAENQLKAHDDIFPATSPSPPPLSPR